MQHALTVALIALIALPALADDARYIGDNHEWAVSCNQNGYVLKSVNPVSRVTGIGAASDFVTSRETLTLGKSCDALHSVFGEGSWCFANGGFGAEFPDHGIFFPRQEIWCEPDPDAACLC